MRSVVSTLILAGLVWSQSALAAVVDEFNTPHALLVETGESFGQSAVVTGVHSAGGTRDLILTRDPSRPGAAAVEIDTVESGIARLSSAFGLGAVWSFRYDGSLDSLPLNRTGLGGIDLADGGSSDRFRVVLHTEAALGATISVVTNESEASIAFVNLPATSSMAVVEVPFTDFAISSGSTAPADFSDVGAIIINFAFFSNPSATHVARIESVSTVPPLSVTFDLDIKPGSDTNPINLAGRGLIPVALLGSESTDVSQVDMDSLAFGPGEALPTHAARGHFEDVNGDGFVDLLSHYRTADAGIVFGAESACVTGSTLSGVPFSSCDAITTVPACGLGVELIFVLLPLGWVRGRRAA
jgi:hypothetical protein